MRTSEVSPGVEMASGWRTPLGGAGAKRQPQAPAARLTSTPTSGEVEPAGEAFPAALILAWKAQAAIADRDARLATAPVARNWLTSSPTPGCSSSKPRRGGPAVGRDARRRPARRRRPGPARHCPAGRASYKFDGNRTYDLHMNSLTEYGQRLPVLAEWMRGAI